MNILTQLLVGIVSIVVLDGLWIGFVANSLYKGWLGPMMRAQANLPAAVLTWVAIVAGIFFFVIQNNSVVDLKTAAGFGAAFGFITYSIYELTNMAVINNRRREMVIVDILWGTVLCAIVASVLFLVK